MKKLFTLFGLGACLLAASCSNEISSDERTQNFDTKGLTSFSTSSATKPAPHLLTAGEYSGSGVNFYWTAGDRLWINNGGLMQDSINDIKDQLVGGQTSTSDAQFFFPGNYNKPSYIVRYTGKNSTSADRITIKAKQQQEEPNKALQLGESGDCGVATAYRTPEGKYKFTLEHKAAYLTFLPYYSKEFSPDVKLTQIKVTADKAIAGTYAFDDNGIKTSAPTNTSKSITFRLKSGGQNGFELPTSPRKERNAAIMVLAPGTYATFTIEYTLYDITTKVGGTVSKTYKNLTLKVGGNKLVKADLGVAYYDNKYYTWDAKQDYWYQHENTQPFVENVTGAGYPTESDNNRWYNPVSFPAKATNTAKNCPNANEAFWYAKDGKPHWDDKTIWCTRKHLYVGGLWLKKKENILNFSSSKDPNGVDRTKVKPTSPTDPYYTNNNVIKARPTNVEDYFFLPALGSYASGRFLGFQDHGDYWTSTPSPFAVSPYGTTTSYGLTFNRSYVQLGSGIQRQNGERLWTAE